MPSASTQRRHRLAGSVVVVAALVALSACGDDASTAATTEGAPPADDAEPTPTDTVGPSADAATSTEVPAEPRGQSQLATNYYEVDGVQYATTIDMCFGVPGQDLEVLSAVDGSDGRTTAYVVTGDDGALVLSNFSVSDPANGVEFIASGDTATGIVFEGRRIAATTPATTADGMEVATSFDFSCPG